MIKYKNEEPKEQDNTINSKHHTMFVEDIQETKIEYTKERGVYKVTPTHQKFTLYISDFMEFERGLHSIFNTLWNASEYDELELRINSGGGLLKEGQQFSNIIENKFKNRTTTILDSMGYSMGALNFLMGDKRIVMENSDLMFHNYSTFMMGKGNEIAAELKHNQRHFKKYFHKLIVLSGALSKKEFEQMWHGKDFWMDTKELCQRGIATHVLVGGQEVKAKKYLKLLKYNQ
jgi:ATP-dependent protease ClpP protease subunit